MTTSHLCSERSLRAGSTVTNWYDALDRLSQRLDGLGTTVYQYAMAGNALQTASDDGPWTADTVILTNRFGRRAGLTIAQPTGQLVVTHGYLSAGYDGAGQLVQAWAYRSDGTPLTSQKWSYGYDPAQNLSKRTNNTTVETFTVNALNQLTSVPDSTPAYDRRGNLVTRAFSGNQTWTYTYDHESRLTSVATDTYYTPEAYRFKVEFVYDGAARLRIKRNYAWSGGGWYGSGGETRYVYDGLLVVQERDGNGTPLVTYTRGRDLSGSLEGAGGIGGLLARSHGYSSGAWSYHHFYHADGNGNVTALVNSGGTLQASYLYDPYGRYLAGTGTLAVTNAMRFSSKPWVAFAGSATSGLYYYGYRFYDPNLQRWVSRDRIAEVEGQSLYAFAGNRLNAIDPDGMKWMPSPRGSGVPANQPTITCRNGRLVPYVPFEFTPAEAVNLWPDDERKRKAYYCAKRCQYAHEQSHVDDALKQNPDICKGVRDYVRIVNPNRDELLPSEIKAHTVSMECLQRCDPCGVVPSRLAQSRRILEHMYEHDEIPPY